MSGCAFPRTVSNLIPDEKVGVLLPNDHSPRHAPPIQRRIASAKRPFAPPSRCEKLVCFSLEFRIEGELRRALSAIGFQSLTSFAGIVFWSTAGA